MIEQWIAARRARGEPETFYTPMIQPLEAHQLINASSFDTDIHSPPEVLDLVHEVMGGVDLDPASSGAANERARAAAFYTESAYEVIGRMEHDGAPIRRYADWGGLSKPWRGRVYLNAPFGTPDSPCKVGCAKKRCSKRGWHTHTALPGMADWTKRFVGAYQSGEMAEGITITFASTSEGWFQPLLQYAQCFPRKRTNYLLPDGALYKGVTKGSAITYCGPNVVRFAAVFSKLGTVKVPYTG